MTPTQLFILHATECNYSLIIIIIIIERCSCVDEVVEEEEEALMMMIMSVTNCQIELRRAFYCGLCYRHLILQTKTRQKGHKKFRDCLEYYIKVHGNWLQEPFIRHRDRSIDLGGGLCIWCGDFE